MSTQKNNKQPDLAKGGNSGDMAHGSIIRVSTVLYCSCVVSYGNGTTILVVCSALTSEANPKKQGTAVKMPWGLVERRVRR